MDPGLLSRRQFGATALGTVGALSGRTAGAQPYPDGLLIADGDDLVELAAYAALRSSGVLTMAYGTLDEVPAVERVPMVICNLGLWYVSMVWCTTRRIFDDGRTERRRLTFALNRVNMRTTRLRIATLEEPRRLQSLLRGLDASTDNPAYAVFGVTNGAIARYYLARIRPEDGDAVPGPNGAALRSPPSR